MMRAFHPKPERALNQGSGTVGLLRSNEGIQTERRGDQQAPILSRLFGESHCFLFHFLWSVLLLVLVDWTIADPSLVGFSTL